MKQSLALTLIISLAAATGGFFGGMMYQKSKNPVLGSGRFSGNSPQIMMRRNGSIQAGGMQPVSGAITAIDATGITIKLPDGSSKIVLISGTTKIVKTSETDRSALTLGETLTAFGSTNQDGSVTAQNISLGNFMFRREPQSSN